MGPGTSTAYDAQSLNARATASDLGPLSQPWDIQLWYHHTRADGATRARSAEAESGFAQVASPPRGKKQLRTGQKMSAAFFNASSNGDVTSTAAPPAAWTRAACASTSGLSAGVGSSLA